MKPKILDVSRICLYCGKEIKPSWEEYVEYYKCNCKDSIKKEKLKNKSGN